MPVDGIRVIGRNTQGVRLINLDEGDKVVSATTVEPDDVASGTDAEATAPVPGTAPDTTPIE
jgi:DNA gyrase subunit A